ncbi:MAG: hypothetical protein LUD15_00940 [Bacteroides sp.]|nr:hypothetical protein [Bacteroides sp.]
MRYITSLMNSMVRGVEKLPHASMDNWVFTPWEVVLIYLIVFWGILYSRGSWSAIFPALFTLLVLAVGNLYTSFREPFSPAIVFYNNRQVAAVHCMVSRDRFYLVSNSPGELPEKLKYAGERYWKSLRLNTPLPVPYSYQDKEIFVRESLVCFSSRTLLFAEVLSGKEYTGCELPKIDHLYVTARFTGSLKRVCSSIRIREIVLDASLSVWRIRQFEEECYRLRIPVRILSEKGACHIPL